MICREFVCAEYILVDDRSKRVSAINIIDDAKFTLLPSFWSLMIYSSLKKEESDGDHFELFVEVKLDDTILSKSPLAISFRGSSIAKSLVAVGIPITAPGTLEVSLSLKTPSLIKNLRSTQVTIGVTGNDGNFQALPTVPKH